VKSNSFAQDARKNVKIEVKRGKGRQKKEGMCGLCGNRDCMITKSLLFT